MPRSVEKLKFHLGTDPGSWPKDRLIALPPEIDILHLSTMIIEAIELGNNDKKRSASLIRSIDDRQLKRWFIDVAQHAGKWRVSHYRHTGSVRRVTKASRKAPARQQILKMFTDDNFHCRYCKSPVIGDRKLFAKLAKHVEVPELLTTGTNEQRHGLYLLFRASHDHVVPLNAGGRDDIENLVTACWPCQFGKYNYTLQELNMNPEVDAPIGNRDEWLSSLRSLEF